MGLPICGRLARRGFVVTATDVRSELRREALGAGARWASCAGAVAAEADVVITMLPGPGEVIAIADELIGALAPGSTWIDMSTASPTAARVVGVAALARAVRVLDAPVGGNPNAAREGRLLAFVGGARADLADQREVLGTLADRILHIGPAGSGYAVKLLVNLLWFGQAVATAEALTVARRAGLDLEVVRAALGQSAAATRFVADDAAALLRGDDLTSFSLARCCEELGSVLAMGDELAVPMELAAVVASVHGQALEHYGEVDGELLGARFVAERAGVSLGALRPAQS
jgi:3-hydroxyisobutyrate dehydrogenase